MISQEKTKEALDRFADYVIQQSRSNLTKGKINASKDLYNSFKKEVEVMPNSIRMTIKSLEYNQYGKFVDKGVKGTESGSSIEGYAYTNKKPPLKEMIRYAKVKPIKPRDKKTGQFITDKAFGFILQNHIFKHGIKPTKFLTTPFERAFKALPDEVVEAYGLDLESFFEYTLNRN